MSRGLFWKLVPRRNQFFWLDVFGGGMMEPVIIGDATLYLGDCLDVLPTLGKVDAVVTDPPYHLTSIVKRSGNARYASLSAGFMGKRWDGGDIAFRPETWRAVFGVLKPGGHALIFGGSRTFHRVACAVEDAGFEIRDTIMWLYGSGFPKSHDVSKGIDKAAGAEREVIGKHPAPAAPAKGTFSHWRSHHYRPRYRPATDAAKQWAGWGTALKPSHEPLIWAQKPLETCDEMTIIGSTLWKLWSRLWLMLPANAAEKYSALSPSGYGVDVSASAQWTADDASNTRDALCARMDMSQFVLALISSLSTVSSWNTTLASSWTDSNTSTTETALETTTDLKTLKLCLSKITPGCIIQAHSLGAWSNADASHVARYFNAAVSKLRIILELSAAENALSEDAIFSQDETGKIAPGCEPIILARKPLTGTVAANVLEHGTGALNIDASRVETEDTTTRHARSSSSYMTGKIGEVQPLQEPYITGSNKGRWPANVIHDGSGDVMEAFAKYGVSKSSGGSGKASIKSAGPNFQNLRGANFGGLGDTGTVARFFYTAKADKADRLNSKHPTVKPVDLIAYLIRLITPPGGTVLDPFAGSGTTGMAAIREGFKPVLIEREEEYFEDIKARFAHIQGADTPLFSETGVV